MAIDNSLYGSLESTYVKMQDYFDSTQLGREHSTMIIKHEELSELLETFDIESLEEQTKDINALHEQLNDIKEVSNKIAKDLNETVDTAAKVVNGLDTMFLKITNVVV